MKLETYSVFHFLRNAIRTLYQCVCRKVISRSTSIYSLSTLIGKFCKIVSLKLHSVDLIIATKFLDFLQAFFFRHLVLTILITRKLLEKVFLREFLPPLFLRSEILWNREEWHDWVTLDIVGFYLVKNLDGVTQCLWHISEHLIHLCLSLKPLLLRIAHTVRIVKILTGRKTQQVVVCLSILLVHEMRVVGTNQFNAILLCEFNKHTVCLLLKREGLTICQYTWVCHLVTLQLQIVVITPDVVIPLYRLTRPLNIILQNLLRNLTTDTSRTDNQILMESSKILTVSSRTTVIPIHPGTRHKTDKVLVAVKVLRKHNEVITAKVTIRLYHIFLVVMCHIHLTTEDRLERFLTLCFKLFINAVTVVKEFLDTKHISVIREGNTLHSISHRLIDKFADRRLSIKDGIVGMNV